MKKLLIIISAVALAACASKEPTVQTGSEAEKTFDGLVRIDNARFEQAWVDPDIDFSVYNKVMGGGAFFEYRAVKDTGNTMRSRSNEDEFYIDDASRERMKEEVSAVFDEELAKSTRFEFVETPGRDVLIIRGGLHDIVSRVPPELVGRGDVYLRSVGEATLVIEGVDSLSGEVIYRAVERRSAERPGGQGMRQSPVTTWAEVRRLARRWATSLREGLDSIPAS